MYKLKRSELLLFITRHVHTVNDYFLFCYNKKTVTKFSLVYEFYTTLCN